MADETIHLGYEIGTGEPFSIPLKHSVLTGITRHGKSETMKAIVERIEELGFAVLIFDVKPQRRDYDDIGRDIPIYLEQAADPRTLRRLLENVGDKSMSYSFSELVKLYEEGFDYADILERIEAWLDEGRHPVQEDKLVEIQYLLRELVNDLDRVEISDELDLEPGINVMDLSTVDDSVQQLAVASSVREVLDHRERTIVCIDEANRFVPQGAQPPANKPLVRMIKEGAAKDVWLWIADQTITGVDKDPLKQVDVWLFGRQREKNEIDRVRDQVGKSNYSTDDISGLKKGHFIVDLEYSTSTVYVQPTWMDDDEARSIAAGEADLGDVDQPEPEEDMDELETEIEQKQARIDGLEGELQDAVDTIEEQREQIEKLEHLLEKEESDDVDPPTAEAPTVDEDRVREIVEDFIEEYEVPGEVGVDVVDTKIVVRRRVEPIEVDLDERLGKVAYLYANDELPNGWFTTVDAQKVLERRGLDATLQRTDVLNQLARMGFLEKRKRSDGAREYQVAMPPDVAEQRGLLELDEQVA